ncbi:MAG: response regulator [Dehalococcoidia bacterium]
MGRAARLLVVDDEPALRHVVVLLLTKMGYEAIAAEGGEAALALLNGGLAPDVILLDLLMPRMSGIQFVEAARGQGYDLPTVLVSASPEAAEHAHRLGLAGHQRKPYDIGALRDTIEAALSLSAPPYVSPAASS